MTMLTPRFSSWSTPLRSNMFGDFDQLIDSFLWPDLTNKESFTPVCDVNEAEGHYLISFDMPGVKQENINIEVVENRLTISGERHREVKNSNVSSFHSERSYGKFQRSFNLPVTVDTDKIEANFENGVLALAIPKTERAKGRTIEIQSGKGGIFSKFLGGKKESNTLKDVTAS